MRSVKYTTYLFAAILLWAFQVAAQDAMPLVCCDPYAIFHAYYEAIGGLSHLKAIRSGYLKGRITYDGLQGEMHSWFERPLRYRSEEDYGIIKYIEGDDGFQSWFQDTNGRVLLHLPGKGMDSSGELAGNLGNSILKRFVVYLDYERQQVILKKGLDFYRRFKEDETGITVGVDEDGMPMVSYVDSDSPAFKAGLRLGDRILVVNGVSAQVLNGTRRVKEILRRWPEIALDVRVQRGGKILRGRF
ncbi:MAG: PDZ domain-containing protein [Dissulfuribacterales bacterium]